MTGPLVGDAVLPLSMVEVRGESIDEVAGGGGGGRKLLGEESLRRDRGW